jgi:hypothetical protein
MEEPVIEGGSLSTKFAKISTKDPTPAGVGSFFGPVFFWAKARQKRTPDASDRSAIGNSGSLSEWPLPLRGQIAIESINQHQRGAGADAGAAG